MLLIFFYLDQNESVDQTPAPILREAKAARSMMIVRTRTMLLRNGTGSLSGMATKSLPAGSFGSRVLPQLKPSGLGNLIGSSNQQFGGNLIGLPISQ